MAARSRIVYRPVRREPRSVYGLEHVIDLAHIYALVGDPEKSVAQLDLVLSRAGWVTAPWLRMDPRWRPLRGNPSFEALLAKYPMKQ